MMDSIRKTSQRTLIVYALFFSLNTAGRFCPFIVQQHMVIWQKSYSLRLKTKWAYVGLNLDYLDLFTSN